MLHAPLEQKYTSSVEQEANGVNMLLSIGSNGERTPCLFGDKCNQKAISRVSDV